MKLYYSKGTCALAVRITLHELNIPCEYVAVQLKEKKLANGDDYYQINPKGVVPVLQLDNGEKLTENLAIQIFLADEYKGTQLLPPMGNFKRYHVIEWLSFVSTDLHKSCSPLFNPNVPAEIKENIFKPLLKSKLDFLQQHLQKNEYLTGNSFTLPDGYLFVVLSWMHHFNIILSEWPEVERFFNQVKQRQSVQQSLAEGG